MHECYTSPVVLLSNIAANKELLIIAFRFVSEVLTQDAFGWRLFLNLVDLNSFAKFTRSKVR